MTKSTAKPHKPTPKPKRQTLLETHSGAFANAYSSDQATPEALLPPWAPSPIPDSIGSDRPRFFDYDSLELWDGNPRKYRSEKTLRYMAAMLKKHGQLESFIVRPHPDPEKRARGIKQVITGGTRYLASGPLYADLPRLLASERDLTDKEARDIAFIENDARKNLTAIETAIYFKTRLEEEGGEGAPNSYRALSLALTEESKGGNYSFVRIQQYVALLTLPAYMIQPVTLETKDDLFALEDAALDEEELIEPGALISMFERYGLTEYHGRGLLMLKEFPDVQRKLWDEIATAFRAKKPISGQSCIARAKKLRDEADALAGIERPKRKPKASQKTAQKYSEGEKSTTTPQADAPASSQPAPESAVPSLAAPVTEIEKPSERGLEEVEGDAPEVDSWESKLRATTAGVAGVGSSAPASSGSGFATASSEGQNLRGAWQPLTIAASDVQTLPGVVSTEARHVSDVVEDKLRPAIEMLCDGVHDLNLIELTPDQRARLVKLLPKLLNASVFIDDYLEKRG